MDAKRRQLAFINAAHFVDHYVLLIFPTVVIGLETDLKRSYADLILLSSACFVAFGLFSLPWGWLGDHWSRRKLMAIFFLGCSGSLIAAALAPNMFMLAVALFVLGIFAAIYHPVGITLLLSNAKDRGRDLATNGVFGNLGVAFAPGVTALIAYLAGWRMAFVIPAVIFAGIGFAYTMMTEEGADRPADRAKVAEMPLSFYVAAAVFGTFAVISFAGGLVFNVVTVAIPKIVDEKFAQDIPLVMIGMVATGVLLFGGVAQIVMGRLVSKYPPHFLFAAIGLVQLAGIAIATVATGLPLLIALAIAIIGIYGQVTVGDVVMARYTADAWRGRIYSVRYFLAFISSGIAISLIAVLHGQGGFYLVLAVTSLLALVFALCAFTIAVLANRAETAAASARPAPAE